MIQTYQTKKGNGVAKIGTYQSKKGNGRAKIRTYQSKKWNGRASKSNMSFRLKSVVSLMKNGLVFSV